MAFIKNIIRGTYTMLKNISSFIAGTILVVVSVSASASSNGVSNVTINNIGAHSNSSNITIHVNTTAIVDLNKECPSLWLNIPSTQPQMQALFKVAYITKDLISFYYEVDSGRCTVTSAQLGGGHI